MSQFIVPVKRHPLRQRDPLRPKWRSLLATLVIAGLATVGVTTLASPAAAEEAEPAASVAADPAPPDPADSAGPAESADPGDDALAAASVAAPDPAPADSAEEAEPPAPDSSVSEPIGESTAENASAAAPVAVAEEEVAAAGSTLTVVSASCTTYGGTGVVHYTLTDVPAFRNFIYILDSEGEIVYSATHLGETSYDVEVDGLAVGGTYTIIFDQEHETGIARLDEQTFTIGACPDIGVSVIPLTCSTDRNGEALLTLTGLVNGIVAFDVQGPDFSVGGLLDEFGATEENDLVGMPPGNYYAYVEWNPFFGEEPPPFPVYDWVGFAIEPCQPDATIVVTECTAAGGTGTAHVTLSSLVAGVEYVAWVTDVGAPDGTAYGEPQSVVVDAAPDATGTAELTFSSLPGDREYTVWVYGIWEAVPPWEEPPFLGNGGNFVPLDAVELSVGIDFALQPCPAAPATSGNNSATLATTGPGNTGGLLLGAMALLVLGGAALFVKRLLPSRTAD